MNKGMFTGDQLQKVIAATERDGNRAINESIVLGKARRSRRHKREGKHTRLSKTTDGRRFTWHETKELPEDTKAKNRKKNKAVKKQKQRARKK